MHRVELLLRDTRLATAEQRLKSPDAGSSGLGFPPPSCSVSLAPLLRSGFYTGLRKQLYLSVIKLASFAGSAQPLVWQTFLYCSRSEYPGQTRLRAAGVGTGGRSPGPRVRGREWERNSWLQAWGDAS